MNMSETEKQNFKAKLEVLIESEDVSAKEWLPVLAKCFIYQQEQIEHISKSLGRIEVSLFGEETKGVRQPGWIEQIKPVLTSYIQVAWIVKYILPTMSVIAAIIALANHK